MRGVLVITPSGPTTQCVRVVVLRADRDILA